MNRSTIVTSIAPASLEKPPNEKCSIMLPCSNQTADLRASGVQNGIRCISLAAMLCAVPAFASPPDCTDFKNTPPRDKLEERWCWALDIKARYSEKFVETAPVNGDGVARNVKSKWVSSFSTNGGTQVSGNSKIEELDGVLRLELASTRNSLYYGRQVKVSGTISTKDNKVVIYSPIDTNLWTLAAVLVDGTDRNAPPPEDGLHLKGYLAHTIEPGETQKFSAELLSLAGDFYLVLAAPDGPAKNIQIEITD